MDRGEPVKISKIDIQSLIREEIETVKEEFINTRPLNEQHVRVARGGSSPMRSRAHPVFARRVKGFVKEADHDDQALEDQHGPGSRISDKEYAIEDLTLELANLLNRTDFVDLEISDIIDALKAAVSPPYGQMNPNSIAKAFGKAIYNIDYPTGI